MSRGRSPWSVLDTAVEVLMAVTLVFLPLAYGATEAWSQEIWYALVAAMGLCVLGRAALDRGTSLAWTWAYVPIGLFIGLVLLQQLPLPPGLASVLSPAAVSTRGAMLDGVGGPVKQTLTLYPFATAQQARWVLAVATVFVVVLQVYRRTERIKRLLITVTLAGLAVAAVGAYGVATDATMIYGVVPVGHKNSGPFQNYSHYSQFLNLSIGGAVGLLCLTLAEWWVNRHWRIDYAANFRDTAYAYVWPAMLLVAVGPLLILAAMSRMGMISTLAAGAVTAALIGRCGLRPGRSKATSGGAFWAIVFGVAVVAVLSFVGLDRFTQRIATLKTQESSTATRLQILRDPTGIYQQFPVFGTGLGTHEFVYPMFSHNTDTALYTHAENEYAQLLEETGVVGLAMAAAFAGVVVVAFRRVTRSPNTPVEFVAFGLGFGLLAVTLHSLTDFGQHIPANATLTATFAALLVRLSKRMDERVVVRTSRRRSYATTRAAEPDGTPSTAAAESPVANAPPIADPPPGRPILALALRGLALVVFAAAAGFVIYRGDVARRAEAAYVVARQTADDLETRNWALDEDALRVLLEHAAMANALEPFSVTYAHWLSAYRWRVVAAGATDPATRVMQLSADDVGFARRIVADLTAARTLCPTFGPPLCVAGQIRSLALKDPAGDADVMRAYALSPYDRTTCYTAGTLAARRGDLAVAGPMLDRYVALGGPRWHVVDTYLLAHRPDLAFDVAKPDRWNLDRLAGGLEASWPGEAKLAAECRALSEQLLIKQSDARNASPPLLIERGNLVARKEGVAGAQMWYQRAVDADYAQVDWRFALAQAQAAAGKREDAVQNLRICLRLRPEWAPARQLLAECSGAPSKSGGK